MSNIHRGSPNALLQRFASKWSPVNGYSEEAEFRGFSAAQFALKAAYYRSQGVEYDWETRFGVHTMRAVDTSGQTTIDSWEVALNKLQPSSLKNPRNIAAVDASNLEIIAYANKNGLNTIRDAIDALKADTGITTATATILADFQADAEAVRLFDRLKKDSVSYTASGYVLRHTTNVSNRYAVNISDYGVDCIYRTDQLLTETMNAALWIYPLPGRLAYKINTLSNEFIFRYHVLDNYQWGWLKSGASESTAANNRVNITTEYEFFNWSTDEYAVV